MVKLPRAPPSVSQWGSLGRPIQSYAVPSAMEVGSRCTLFSVKEENQYALMFVFFVLLDQSWLYACA